jgi:quercetin dioxygenase-like cupin family protein
VKRKHPAGAGRSDKENPMITQALKPHVNTTSEPPLYFLGLPTLVRATAQTTNGAFGLIEHLTMPPGFASPYHTHRQEDEAFYVLEGQMAFVCDGTWTIAGPGTYVFGPRDIPHGFKVIGDAPARMLLLCSPGGFEQFVVDLGAKSPAPPDMAKLMALAAEYRVDIHGPLPEER